MKRILPVALAAVMLFTLVGCTVPRRARGYNHPYETRNFQPYMSAQSAIPGL